MHLAVGNDGMSDPASKPDVQRASTYPGHINEPFPNQRHPTYPQQPLFLPDQVYSDVESFATSEPSMMDSNIGINFNQFSFANSNNNASSIPGYNIPDLSAMMFPSTDPFDYPNQPMTTLENHTSFSSSNPQASNTKTSTAEAATTTRSSSLQLNLYGGLAPRGSLSNGSGLEAQFLDPLQPYLSMDYGQIPNVGRGGGVFDPEMRLGCISNLVKEEQEQQEQQEQQPQPQQWWVQIDGDGEAMTMNSPIQSSNTHGTGGWAI